MDLNTSQKSNSKRKNPYCDFACCKHNRDPNEPNHLPGITSGKTVFYKENPPSEEWVKVVPKKMTKRTN